MAHSSEAPSLVFHLALHQLQAVLQLLQAPLQACVACSHGKSAGPAGAHYTKWHRSTVSSCMQLLYRISLVRLQHHSRLKHSCLQQPPVYRAAVQILHAQAWAVARKRTPQ